MRNQLPVLQEEFFASKPERRKIFQSIVRGWLRFSGPNVQIFKDTIEDQERLRRSRLLSGLFSLIIAVVLLAGPTAIPVPTYWIPIIVFLILGSIALMLNRGAYVLLSALFYILAIDTTLTILMITLPTGIRNSNIPDFDLFFIPILIGGMVLPRRLLPWLAAIHIFLIIALFTLLPHDPLLQQEIAISQKGFAYSELSDALMIQVIGTMVAWLGAWSVDRALQRASRAEDLAEARRRISEQAQQLVGQKSRLDYGISVLKDAHARFANGNYKARAKLLDNELTSLAFSFNLMAERLDRITQVTQDYTRLEQGLRQLIDIQGAILNNRSFKPFQRTGTLADHLYPSFQRYSQVRQRISQGNAAVEKVRVNLTQQKSQLAQLTSALNEVDTLLQLSSYDSKTSRTASIQSVGKAQQLCIQINERERQCLQEVATLEQVLRESQG